MMDASDHKRGGNRCPKCNEMSLGDEVCEACSHSHLSAGSVPSMAEYMAITKALVKAHGFAVPTNPDFYKNQYAQFAKDWEAQNSKSRNPETIKGDL